MAKVLLIDDDPQLRMILSRILNKNDFEVIIAEDGPAGLHLARQKRPDLIILDIMMPGMDGFEVAQRLHHDPVCARIPIMVLTAYATPYGRKTAIEIGIDDFVTKPFGIDEIVAKVRAMTSAPILALDEPAIPLKTAGQARLIGLHSLRGGLGCTSLAISLAAVLKNLWRWPTLLLDADFAIGQIALALNRRDSLSWSDLIQAGKDDELQSLLENRLMVHEDGLHVLAAPRDSHEAERISPKAVEHSLGLLTQPYEYIVADLAHDLRENTLTVARNADQILHLMAADAVSVRLVKRALVAYRARGIRLEDVLLVLVDTRPGKPARIGELELALGQSLAAHIPYAATMTEAIDRGLPFVDAFPDHRLTHLLEDLAYLLSKPDHRDAGQPTPTPVYRRVLARDAAAAHNGGSKDVGGYMLKRAGIGR